MSAKQLDPESLRRRTEPGPDLRTLPDLENFDPAFQRVAAKAGYDIVAVRFDRTADNPCWADPDIAESLAVALGRFGHFDGSVMSKDSYCCLYHLHDLGAGLAGLHGALETRGLLAHCQILCAEHEAGWRVYWPASGELLPHST